MRKLEKGAVSVEYILITALIAIALIVGWAYMQTQMEINQKALAESYSRNVLAAVADATAATGTGALMANQQVSGRTFASRNVGGLNPANANTVWSNANTAGAYTAAGIVGTGSAPIATPGAGGGGGN